MAGGPVSVKGGRMCERSPLLVLSLITLATGTTDAWTSPQSQPKTLTNLLVSLDERLHSLDNTKWDSTLREMEQRLESFESTLRRLDSTFQERLDKLERNLNSKELKDELMVEKLSHKMRDILDTSYDRYSRRLGYTEERLELSLKKVQMSVEGILNRMEKQQEDIQTDVTETVALMEDFNRLNSTHKAIHQQIQSLMTPNREDLQRISGSLEHINKRLNGSLEMCGSQKDGPQTNDLISTIRSDINSESTKITNKMNNMYHEMWRRVVSVESLLKDLGRLGNTTRQEVLDEVRSLVPPERDFPSDSQENFLEVVLEVLERKLQKLNRNVDDRMDTLIAKQDLVLDSYFEGGMCQGLESRLSKVLERIIDILSDKIENSTNRTIHIDILVQEMMELVKLQHSNLIRTVAYNTNMVMSLAKDSGNSNKQLHYNITELANHFQELHAELDTASNSNWKLCDENTTTTEIQESVQTQSKNITEEKLTPINIIEKPVSKSKKRYDIGVLKITTDNFGILADNTSLQSENTPRMVDHSIINIITTVSPNITSDQIESLLWVLNNSMSFDNLEAIVQNTEAEPTMDVSNIERFDDEPLNTTNTEDNSAIIGEIGDTDLSVQKDHNSEDNEEQEITTDNIEETEIPSQGSVFNETRIKETNPNKTGLLSEELKEELKLYIFLWRIKHGFINITLLKQQIEENEENDIETIQLLPVLNKLCYGQDKKEYNIIKETRLVTGEALSDTDFYGIIKDVCNMMSHSMYGQDNHEDEML